MYCCYMSKVMSSLYFFGIDVIYFTYSRLESSELDKEPLPLKYLGSSGGVQYTTANSGALASNMQNKNQTRNNDDDISLRI
jgi:hypothetical protein